MRAAGCATLRLWGPVWRWSTTWGRRGGRGRGLQHGRGIWRPSCGVPLSAAVQPPAAAAGGLRRRHAARWRHEWRLPGGCWGPGETDQDGVHAAAHMRARERSRHPAPPATQTQQALTAGCGFPARAPRPAAGVRPHLPLPWRKACGPFSDAFLTLGASPACPGRTFRAATPPAGRQAGPQAPTPARVLLPRPQHSRLVAGGRLRPRPLPARIARPVLFQRP
jgi:hypothetical protein